MHGSDDLYSRWIVSLDQGAALGAVLFIGFVSRSDFILRLGGGEEGNRGWEYSQGPQRGRY